MVTVFLAETAAAVYMLQAAVYYITCNLLAEEETKTPAYRIILRQIQRTQYLPWLQVSDIWAGYACISKVLCLFTEDPRLQLCLETKQALTNPLTFTH